MDSPEEVIALFVPMWHQAGGTILFFEEPGHEARVAASSTSQIRARLGKGDFRSIIETNRRNFLLRLQLVEGTNFRGACAFLWLERAHCGQGRRVTGSRSGTHREVGFVMAFEQRTAHSSVEASSSTAVWMDSLLKLSFTPFHTNERKLRGPSSNKTSDPRLVVGV